MKEIKIKTSTKKKYENYYWAKKEYINQGNADIETVLEKLKHNYFFIRLSLKGIKK